MMMATDYDDNDDGFDDDDDDDGVSRSRLHSSPTMIVVIGILVST